MDKRIKYFHEKAYKSLDTAAELESAKTDPAVAFVILEYGTIAPLRVGDVVETRFGDEYTIKKFELAESGEEVLIHFEESHSIYLGKHLIGKLNKNKHD